MSTSKTYDLYIHNFAGREFFRLGQVQAEPAQAGDVGWLSALNFDETIERYQVVVVPPGVEPTTPNKGNGNGNGKPKPTEPEPELPQMPMRRKLSPEDVRTSTVLVMAMFVAGIEDQVSPSPRARLMADWAASIVETFAEPGAGQLGPLIERAAALSERVPDVPLSEGMPAVNPLDGPDQSKGPTV